MKNLTLIIVFYLLFCFQIGAKVNREHATVLFATNNNQLSEVAKGKLIKLIDKAQSSTNFEIFIIGHTDSRGSVEYNEKLSSKRSSSVYQFLIDNGISPKYLTMSYKGELAPIAPNHSNKTMELNRRVEVVLSQYEFEHVEELEAELQRDKHQKILVQPTEENVIRGKNGVMIHVPSFAFINSSGELMKDEVQLELVEALNVTAFISSNLTTQSNDRLLETGGMFQLTAKSIEGDALKLAENTVLTVAIPTAERQDSMEVFVSSTGNNWISTDQPITNKVAQSLEPFPVLRLPSYNFPKFSYQIERPTLPSIPTKYRVPNKPQEKSYQRKIAWYVLNKKEQLAKQENNYQKAVNRYMVRMEKYNKRQQRFAANMEKYDREMLIYQEAMTKWERDKEMAMKNFRFEPEYLAAVEKSKKLNEQARTSYKKEVAEWREKRKLIIDKWASNIDKMGIENNGEMEHYLFEVNTLNWINCDRFYDIKPKDKMTIVLAGKNASEEKAFIIFKNIRSIMKGTPDEKENLFVVRNIAKNEKAYIFAYKVKDKKPMLCFEEMNGRAYYELQYVESSFVEIKSILESFNSLS